MQSLYFLRYIFFVFSLLIFSPTKDAMSQSFEIPTLYEVKEGETIYDLARRFSLSLNVLVDINGLRRPYAVKRGDVLLLPQPLFHRVSAGETARSIANLHSVNFEEFAAINGLFSPNFSISVGQDLRLPGGSIERSVGREAQNQAGNTGNTGNESTLNNQNKNTFSNQAAAGALGSTGSGTLGSTGSVEVNQVEIPPTVENNGAAAISERKYIWPLNGKVVKEFGNIDRGVANEGIDISVPEGTEVKAVASGTVAYSGNDLPAYGNLILIKHDDGFVSAYAHNSQLIAGESDRIRQGDVIALSGSTGEVSVPKLHFELRRGRLPVDPMDYLGRF